MDERWWPTAVIYQIYPRSFADADGDGTGDLNGVRARLDYLAGLGVDAIWLSPFYPSPQADGGYDVADYCDVDPLYGTLGDFRALVADCHERGLRIVIDLVPNHTSDQHAWFQAALRAGPGSAERARYIFRAGRGDLPPNNWTSNFGGPAWTRLPDGQWYLHLFAPQQPDLDWTNPAVVSEFETILRFWLDLGVDGFRIDVAHGLSKDPNLADLPEGMEHALGPTTSGEHPHWDRDDVHDVYRRWRKLLDTYGPDRMFVGEIWVPNPARFAQYLRPDELHTAFNFNFLEAEWDAAQLRDVIQATLDVLAPIGAPATWVLSNHDVERHVTRYGGGTQGLRRARAAALLMLALPGGAYVYQGEELGLAEVRDIPAAARQDPIFFRTKGARRGRDGCRVPLPWRGASPPYGFTTGAATWLPQPADWAALAVAAQDRDPASMLAFYRRALAARHATSDLHTGAFRWLSTGEEDVLAFARGAGFGCVVNLGTRAVQPPDELRRAAILLASADVGTDGRIPADAAVWYARSGDRSETVT